MPDVVVVGGGPVGLATALLLVRSGVSVDVWEQRTEAPTGTRAIGVHPPSLELFASLGLDGPLLEHAVRIDRGEAWSTGRFLGSVAFDTRPTAFPFIAATEQWRTERLLRARLEDLAPGTLRTGTRCLNVRDDTDAAHLVGVRDGHEVTETAAVVVIAAGGRAGLGVTRAPAEARLARDRYLMGDVADLSSAGPVARVHLHRDGVVESFPLPDGRRRYVVHTGLSPAAAPSAVATAEGLADLVTERTGDPVDPTSNTMLSAFTVRRRRLRRMVEGRLVHLGDAAHEISPIGGQGMNLGWLDAQVFAPLVIATVHSGSPDPRLPAASRRQLATAARAGRQAQLNMSLGRPRTAAVGRLRDLALRIALNSPLTPVLADAYTMRWAPTSVGRHPA
ncbi:FAD-dependent monooxygenase [Plantibacter flavus]|uniref:FAD-dependent oxidoreductase n=1 Tax=Plantibacter flavus TaxID=150123 RepID=UPI003F158672